NPFNPTTTISFAVPSKSFVIVKVYNALGKEVRTLANGEYEAGRHTLDFNAADLASGVYYYTISAGNFTATKKMILMK
ncbi:MAG: peptidase S8, partial [Ignavibacteriales bacterium UTCHB3]